VVNCCCAKPVSVFEDIDDIGAPSRLSKWCGHLVSSVKKDPAISILTHIFIISVIAAASGLASYLSYNPVKNPIDDHNQLFPAALSILGVLAITTTVSECIRLRCLLKMSRKLPSPCVVAAVAIAVATVMAYWMREKAAEQVAKYQKNESLPYPDRAYQILASDTMPDWYYAIAGSFTIALVYHASLRAVIRCRKRDAEVEPLFIN
jgi:hypothetical protein